ncbi:MAG: heme-binding protein [Isosphaeraceae bacterium]
MNVKIVTLLCWLALGSGLAGQEPSRRGQQDLFDQVPRLHLDVPQQRDGRRMPPELTTVPSDVRDAAGLFSAKTLQSARESLEKIEKAMGVPVLVETIETLGGETIDEAATRHARRSGTQGVFILIARKETKIEVLASRRYSEALPRPSRIKVRSAFIESFRKRDFDEGLTRGIAALEAELATAKREKKLPLAEQPAAEEGRPSPLSKAVESHAASSREATAQGEASSPANSPQDKPLVIRNQVRLTLEGARVIIAAAEKQAAALNLKSNIAVVDDGGHLISFDRMNGARPASGYTAITKASSAATFRQPSGPVPAGTTQPDPLLNLSLQLAARASGGKLTTLHGGIPIVVDGQVIGGVGVGGGTGEQDAQVARAGVRALLEVVEKQTPR